MVAREAPRVMSKRIGLTFDASEHLFLQRTLFEHKAILLTDVAREPEWRDVQPLDRIQSWLGVPLIAAGHASRPKLYETSTLLIGIDVPSTRPPSPLT
jgi:GAF domain-containing protein